MYDEQKLFICGYVNRSRNVTAWIDFCHENCHITVKTCVQLSFPVIKTSYYCFFIFISLSPEPIIGRDFFYFMFIIIHLVVVKIYSNSGDLLPPCEKETNFFQSRLADHQQISTSAICVAIKHAFASNKDLDQSLHHFHSRNNWKLCWSGRFWADIWMSSWFQSF